TATSKGISAPRSLRRPAAPSPLRRRRSGVGRRPCRGSCLVARATVGAVSLLHLRLVDVPPTVDDLVADRALPVVERRPVAVVEVLDHLERPPAVEHVP